MDGLQIIELMGFRLPHSRIRISTEFTAQPTSPLPTSPPAHKPPAHQLALLHHHSQYLDTSVHKQEQHIFTGKRKPIRFIRVLTCHMRLDMSYVS